MITELAKDELVGLGARHRAAYLVEQAGYTLGVTAEEGEAIQALLDAGYLDEVRAASVAVEAERGDRQNLESETREATLAQNTALSRAKIWRRRVVSRGRRARRMGRQVPDMLVRISAATTVPAVRAQLVEITHALEASLGVLGGESARALLEDGRRLVQDLAAADAEQERKRLSALPQKVRDFYAAKGALYVGLKVVNDAGHELHADDPMAAARFNLKILYRKAGAKRPEGGPTKPA